MTPYQYIVLALVTFLPIFILGAYFHHQNPRRQPIWEIIKIFLLGLVSVIPVLLYDLYFLDWWSDTVIRYFPEWTALAGYAQLIALVIFIGLFVLLFSAVQALVMSFEYHLSWFSNFRSVFKKIYNLTPLLIFFVGFMLIEIIVQLGFKVDFILTFLGSTVIFAVLEEYFKYLINPFLSYRRLSSIGEAIVNCMYVGLAFAFIENILFFSKLIGSENFFTIFIFRSFFTTLLHVAASGIIGYFYGLSLFSKVILANYEIERSQYNVLAGLRTWLGLRKKHIFQSASITRGFFLAASIHALINLILMVGGMFIAGGVIIILAYAVLHLLKKEEVQQRYGIVGSEAMPQKDFEELRLKISVMQHLKEIQKTHKKP